MNSESHYDCGSYSSENYGTCSYCGKTTAYCRKCHKNKCPSQTTTCVNCKNSYCSRCATKCSTCNSYACSQHSKVTCSTCQAYNCPAHTTSCGYCTYKQFCPSHAATCRICKQSYCTTTHGTKLCSFAKCTEAFCSGHSNEHITTCTACKIQYCPTHSADNIKTCHICKTLICISDASTCTSCNEIYCSTHLPNHMATKSTTNNVIYCVNQSEYARYESPAKLLPAQNGVGTFAWPDGHRTMCWFYGDKLILSRDLHASDCHLIEERQKFEKYRKEEEIKWKEHEFKRETEAKEKEVLEKAAKEKEAKEKEAKEKALKEMEDEVTKLKQKNDELETVKKSLEQEKEQAQKFIASNKGPIKLNVGGVQFQTTLGNISKYPSKLSTMFNGMFEVEKDDSGAVFIDRDGTHFRYILNFLRDGSLPPNLSTEALAALKVEAEFYQLVELTSALSKL